MSVSTRVGAALAAGYLLGRFRKLRLALIVGSAMSNKSVRSSGLALLDRTTGGLTASPGVQKIGRQVTTQLADAGRSAAIALASSRIDRLSDQLNERSARLRGELPDLPADEPADEPTDEPADEPQDEAEDDYDDARDERDRRDERDEPEDSEEPEEPEEAPRRRRPRRHATSSGGAR